MSAYLRTCKSSLPLLGLLHICSRIQAQLSTALYIHNLIMGGRFHCIVPKGGQQKWLENMGLELFQLTMWPIKGDWPLRKFSLFTQGG